jgi:hypothetical protein
MVPEVEWANGMIWQTFLLSFVAALLSWFIHRMLLSKRPQTPPPSLPPAAPDHNPRELYKAAVARDPDAFPLAARWLASSHDPCRPLAYALRGSSHATGLQMLQDNSLWLELDPCRGRFHRELRLKAALLGEGSPYSPIVSAFEDENADSFDAASGSGAACRTLAAQTEVLHRVLHQIIAAAERARACKTLPYHMFEYTDHGAGASVAPPDESGAAARVASVHVVATGMTFRPSDPHWRRRPIALAALLVQEDFILLRKGKSSDALADGSCSPSGDGFVFVAGAACFAFSEVGLRGERGRMKLGQEMSFVHSSVPAFETHIASRLRSIFLALQPEAPMYRANWSLAPSGILSPFEHEIDMETLRCSSNASLLSPHLFSRDGALQGVVYATAGIPPQDLHLKVELQTVHKLRAGDSQSETCDAQYILFTVRTYTDQLSNLAMHAGCGRHALASLARTIRSLTPEQLKYRDLADHLRRQSLLDFLDAAS